VRARLRSCPFCKAASYTIVYRGPMATQERERLQAEEQRVIELQIDKQNRDERAYLDRLSSQGIEAPRPSGGDSGPSQSATSPIPIPLGGGSRGASLSASPDASPRATLSDSLLASVRPPPRVPPPPHSQSRIHLAALCNTPSSLATMERYGWQPAFSLPSTPSTPPASSPLACAQPRLATPLDTSAEDEEYNRRWSQAVEAQRRMALEGSASASPPIGPQISHAEASAHLRRPHPGSHDSDTWQADLEELMLLEAIRQSLSDQQGGSGGGVGGDDDGLSPGMADVITSQLAAQIEQSIVRSSASSRGRGSGGDDGGSSSGAPEPMALPPSLSAARLVGREATASSSVEGAGSAPLAPDASDGGAGGRVYSDEEVDEEGEGGYMDGEESAMSDGEDDDDGDYEEDEPGRWDELGRDLTQTQVVPNTDATELRASHGATSNASDEDLELALALSLSLETHTHEARTVTEGAGERAGSRVGSSMRTEPTSAAVDVSGVDSTVVASIAAATISQAVGVASGMAPTRSAEPPSVQLPAPRSSNASRDQEAEEQDSSGLVRV
jgi:hypothetical protein